jgi:hypothetical protein
MMATSPLDPSQLASLAGQAGGGFGGQQQQPPTPPAQGAGMTGDPTYPPDPGSQQPSQQGSPTDQVIWQAFPSTDPNTVGQMLQGVDGSSPTSIAQVLPALEQMQMQDRYMLEQRQQQTLQALLGQLAAPAPGSAMPPAAGPAVGGDSGSY